MSEFTEQAIRAVEVELFECVPNDDNADRIPSDAELAEATHELMHREGQ